MSAPISASGKPDRSLSLTAPKLLLLLTAATLAVRLLVAELQPLTADEAYYRLWSMRPALGYYDHPPMLAWWIWLGRGLAGDTPLGVRLLPTLAAAATTLLTYALARLADLGGSTAARAALWFNATILVGLGGELAVPDAPTSLFWTAALCFALLAIRGRAAWWVAAGACGGLACLSKYSGLFLAPGILLWLAVSPTRRRSLFSPWLWLGALTALAVFLPNVVWNAQHGWMTFAKQFGRVGSGALDPPLALKFVSDQILLLNPLIALFVALSIRRRAAAPFLLISAPFLSYLAVHSLHAEVQGQWPAPLYSSLAIAAAVAAEGVFGWLAWIRAAAAPLGFGVCLLAFLFILSPPDPGMPAYDPAVSLRGWPGFAARIEAVRQDTGAGWVGAPDYALAAQLAAAPQVRAPVVELVERQRYSFETARETANFTLPGLVITPGALAGEAWLGRCFRNVQRLPEIDRGRGAKSERYSAFLVAGPQRDIEHAGCAGPSLQPNR